jgi:hypothetical protein
MGNIHHSTVRKKYDDDEEFPHFLDLPQVEKRTFRKLYSDAYDLLFGW